MIEFLATAEVPLFALIICVIIALMIGYWLGQITMTFLLSQKEVFDEMTSLNNGSDS